MKKLLLTSTGFVNPKIGERFLSLLIKKPSETRVLFIPTASRTEDEVKYVRESEDELIQAGISKESIIWLDINNVSAAGNINRFDVIYVCGGNTFFLMQKLRETGLDKKIIELVRKGVVYVGASAGSVIAGPDISIAAPFDKNDIGLKDTTGLHLTDKVTSPHYKDEEKNIIDEFKKKLPYPVIPLTDNQALEETDDYSTIVE